MLLGLGLGIATGEISVSSLPHFLVFGLLLAVILIDHRRTLIYPETLPSEEKTKPEFMPKPKPVSAGKPRFSLPAISSLFSLFKRGKKTIKPQTKPEAAEKDTAESATVAAESTEEESEIDTVDDLIPTSETTEEDVSVEPEKIEESPKHFVSSESTEEENAGTSEKQLSKISGENVPGDLPEFEVKEDLTSYEKDSYKSSPIIGYKKENETETEFKPKATSIVQPLEESDAEKRNKEILENIEKIYPEEKGIKPVEKELEKRKFLETEIKKPTIPKEELSTLKKKLADRKNEIKSKTTIVIQDVQKGFKNIETGLDSLKDELKTIDVELKSPVRKADRIEKEYGDARPLSYTPTKYRKTTEREIKTPTAKPRYKEIKGKRKQKLRKAQFILKDLEKRVKKLEKTYIQ